MLYCVLSALYSTIYHAQIVSMFPTNLPYPLPVTTRTLWYFTLKNSYELFIAHEIIPKVNKSK